MEELQRFIARAQHLAEKAVSEADISAAYGIVKILLVLAEKAAGQPVKAEQTQPAKAGRKQAAKQTAATPAAKETRADDARDVQTDREDATQRPGVTWANVVTRSPQARGGYVKAPGVSRGKRLRPCDWHVEVVEAEKAEDIRQGVVYAGRKETGEQLGAGYRELLEMEAKDLRVALVTPGRLTDESRERIVRFDNGTEASCYVTQWGGADVGRVPIAKEVEVGDATTVMWCTVMYKDVDEKTRTSLKSAATGAGAADVLCRRAAAAAGVTIERRHRFNHRCTSTRHTVSVRVTTREAPTLLRSSGKGGVYWAAPSFVNGNELHPVVWLAEDAKLEQAMEIAGHADALGVAAARTRYGVRYSASNPAARRTLIDRAGSLAAPERQGPPEARFLVESEVGEHQEEMLAALRAVQWDCRVTKCFVTGRRTNLVVNASTDPPAEVVKRANRTPLYIRRVRVGDVPSGTKHWKGRIPNARLPQGEQDAPPAARQEDVAPSAKRKAGEMEGEAAGSAEGEMQVDAHVHNWGDDVEKTKVAWKCSRCNGGKGKNTLQRKCACGARVCHECYRTREKAGSG